MLCQFTVKNLRCFRDEITLDMQAAAITENEDSLITDSDGKSFLPLAVVYGPNGAGKSTVLSALYSLCLKIMRPICAASCDRRSCGDRPFCKEQSSNILIEPFAFTKDTSNSPTEYELFFRTETREYQYQLHIQKNKISFESLSTKKILGSRYTNYFTRTKSVDSIRVSLIDNGVSRISDDLPLLSYLIITHSDHEVMRDIFSWLTNRVDFRNYGSPVEEAVVSIDPKRKSLILAMLKEMDIDIDDYRVEKTNNKLEVFSSHTVDNKTTELSLTDESSGTVKVFGLLPYLVRSIIDGSTLVIDELDAKLHPFLLKYIIQLYSNPSVNNNGAQLIFTSHDLTTMNSEFFRRDEVWYVAKTGEGAAKLYSLVEFARKDAKYDKQYIEGRYGACPYLQRIIDWEEVE